MTSTRASQAAKPGWPAATLPILAAILAEINKLLISYNIPILDEAIMPITTDTLSKRP